MPVITSRVRNRTGIPQRRSIYEVLGLPDGGASARGSTYYKSFQACPREHGLLYDAGITRTVPSDALTIGLLYHYCNQRFYEAIAKHQRATPMQPSNTAWLWGGKNEGADKVYQTIELFEAEDGYAVIAPVLRATMEGYLERYDQEDRWRIIAVEETLEHWKAIEYTTRLDLVIEDYDRGGMFIVEHKTAGRITDDLLDNYQMDGQVLGQIWLIHRCVDLTKYPPFRGTISNISCKSTPKSSPEYTRVQVSPSQRHLAAFENTLATRPEMAALAKKLGYPRWFGNCSGYARGYSKCPYYSLCHDYPQHGVAHWKRPDIELPEGYSRKVSA